MGQRSQVIVSVPPIQYGKGNPNNKPRRIFVFHNHWLYGFRFIKFANDMMFSLASSLKNMKANKQTFTTRELKACLKWSNCNDFDHMTTTEEEVNEEADVLTSMVGKVKTEDELIEHLTSITDNNNGFILIHISDDYKVTYQLLNGLEDADEIKDRTPMQYVELFYQGEELTKRFKEWPMTGAVKELEAKPRANVLKLMVRDMPKRLMEEL